MPMNGRAVETAMPGSSSRPLSPRSSTGSIRSISGGGAMRRRSRFTTVAALTAVAAVGPAAAIKTLAAGGDHACVITTTGGVKCWGQNSKGQLGYQDVVKRTAPPADYVDLGENRSAVSITAGDAHTCAVLDNGNLKVRRKMDCRKRLERRSAYCSFAESCKVSLYFFLRQRLVRLTWQIGFLS